MTSLLIAAAVLGWNMEFADGSSARVNYDNAAVAPYTLEDPLAFFDGSPVKTAADWQARRREILAIFEREMYGKRPPLPDAVVTDLVDEKLIEGGTVIRRQYEMRFRPDRSGPVVRWIVFIPAKAVGRIPVILALNYHGNQSLVADTDIPMMTAYHRNGKWGRDHRAVPETRGLLQRRGDSATTFPLEKFVSRGYAVMSACYCEVSPDPNREGDEDPRIKQDELAYTGVFDLWPKRDPAGKSEYTSLGAWSWALSRGLDLAERIPEIDAGKSVVTGCSRLGKAALIAAAYDERFAVCVPVQTGNGGAPLAKRDFGENPATETRMFTHWFCRAYDKYRVAPWKSLTFDQHLLLAAVAPRSLLVLGFNNPWFDTRGEFLACRAASCTWERFGRGGLPPGEQPATADTSCVGDSLGYARRDGEHAISDWDWSQILDFSDVAFGRLATFPRMEPDRRDFQRDIDDAAARGGGRVVVPAGRHLTGGLILRSNVELHLEKGAVLEGSTNTNDYPVVELPFSEGKWMAVVMAVGATNVAVTGEGEIFGNGSLFPRAKGPNQEGTRPRGLFFGNCRNVRLEGFRLRDSACWGCVVQCCEGVVIRGLRIDNHANANNDGIDIEARRAVIADCDIDAGDDGVCLKSNNPDFVMEDVLVSNVVARSHCVPFKIGTASHGVVRNVGFVDCRVEAPRRDYSADRDPLAYRPCSWRVWCEKDFPASRREEPSGSSGIAIECVDGGLVEDVVCRNIVIDGGCYVPIFVRAGWRQKRSTGAPRGRHNVMRRILFDNVTGHSLSSVPSSVTGIPGFRVQDVTFRNMRLTVRGGGENAEERTRPVSEYEGLTPGAGMFRQALPAYGLWARHVDSLHLDNVSFVLADGTFDRRDAIVLDDVRESLAADGSFGVGGAENCVVDPAEYGFSPDAAPDVNRQALQRALDGGRRMVRTSKGGVYGLDGTVFIDSDTVLEFAPGTVLKKMKPYCNVLVNRAAFNYGCDSNIVVRNVEISVNGMQGKNDENSNAPGLRGNFAFYRVRNVECHNFSCFDLESSQYCWQAVDFDGLVLDGFTIRGKKDGVHLNCGRNFVIRNGVLRTGDDGIALNAGEWPGGCTPKMGSIENGVIENIVDEAGGKCNFIRVITGCWKEWHPGMKLQRNDIFTVGRNVYCVWPMPVSSKEYVSMTAPTHAHGAWKSPEGINFLFLQDNGETRADIRNVTIRNVRMECERSIACHWEICNWARLIRPEIPNADYPVIDIRIENLVKTAPGPVVYGDASCRVTFRNVRAERGQLIAMNRHSKGVRGTPLYASVVHVKAEDCEAAGGGGPDILLDDPDGTGSVEISGWKGLRAARLGGRAMPRIAISGDTKAETTDALLDVAGSVTDKTPGWRFEASNAKDGKTFNPSEGWYPDKGGKLISPRVFLPNAGAYYKLSFTGSAPVRSYETVALYDAAGNMIADNYDVIYGVGVKSSSSRKDAQLHSPTPTQNSNLQRYERVVFAQEGVKAAEVFFQSPKGCTVSDVKFEPATVDEAAKWCDGVYAKLPPLDFGPVQAKLPPKTLDALKTGTPWRILMLGDSIMQDTFHSQFHALVKRAYPKSDVTWLVSVRGSTGCWYYCEPENFRKYVADYKPDCVFIGGISGWIHPEMPLNGGPAIESVARRVNKELGAEVVVMTPTLAIDLRVPEGTERGTAVAPSKFDHAALGDRAWKYDAAAAEELKAICAKNGWPLWDMFTPACDWLFKTGLPSEFYSRDYVHSGELGKQIIGRIALGYFAAAKGCSVGVGIKSDSVL